MVQEFRVTRADIVELLKKQHEDMGYHVTKIFPHQGGYIIDAVKKEEKVDA